MLLYKTPAGAILHHLAGWRHIASIDWDDLLRREDLPEFLNQIVATAPAIEPRDLSDILPPIGRQEVWAAGVTYFRSRTARMEEASDAGGSSFYDRVYHADRPELFMKATAHRVVGHAGTLRLRKDSKWMVPEPELTLLVSPAGRINGYAIGNDMSCRDIEGENPLYLPQAKTFDQCAGLGPGIFVTRDPLPSDTAIRLQIYRNGRLVFEDNTALDQMRKTPDQLVSYLYREASFPDGCFLMTGTGIVPPDTFTLENGDAVHISIEPIGTLINTVSIF
ncbi:MAG: fumarylacetoacetate hydrolase family protein [Rhodothermales bacterium]